jgi:hypothetical protein
MKKIHLLLPIFILILLLSGIVRAKATSTDTNIINEIKQKIIDIKQQSAEQKEKIKTELASTTAELKNARQELKNTVEIKIGKKLDAQKIKIANVFENSMQNLKDLITRIESRISKIESENINISTPKTLLETAKANLVLAETELTNLENLLASDLPTISTSTSKNNIRKTILKNINLQSEKTKSAIKTAHKSIVVVVASLKKGLMKEKNSTSTSQAATTTNN